MAFRHSFRRVAARLAIPFAAAAVLSSCQTTDVPAYLAPITTALLQQMEAIGTTPVAPIYVRVFKEESEFEIWKRRPDGTYGLLKTYAICAWSGELGPKKAEGDRQAPEGFYSVGPAQLNPNSSYHLSFNIGYPNAFDRSLGRTGTNLMVHGACSSAGCYSMTDESVEEIYAVVREAFAGGQRSFQIHAFPFRMTAQNMARHSANENFAFWQMLKEGYDHFEVTRTVPSVEVCDFRYVFDAVSGGEAFEPTRPCPAYTIPERVSFPLVAQRAADAAAYDAAVAALVASGELVAGVSPALFPDPMAGPLTAFGPNAGIDPTTTAGIPPMPLPRPTP
ncbi:MAG: murein L,D-transpeptidase [Bauldia sp.]|nr:murein L,D-transpeptidase [Bauldia sp.]